MITAGGACAFGGDGIGCEGAGDLASANTVAGTMAPIDRRRSLLIIGLVEVGAEVTAPISTGARCFLDAQGAPAGEGSAPEGTISYKGSGLLGSVNESAVDFADLASGTVFEEGYNPGVLLNLLLALYVDVVVETRYDWDPVSLRAYSEVKAHYAITDGSSVVKSETYTARSECGLKMSDGSGSDATETMSLMTLPSQLNAHSRTGPESPTSAPGSPQSSGFTTEDTMDDGTLDYHLLATRELDSLDRLVIEEVLAEIAESGEVEGSSWKVFDASAAGELVPVIEIELDDGAIVQVRPMVEGAVMPAPDLVEAPATTTATTAAPQPTAPSTTRETFVPEELTPEEPTPVEESLTQESLPTSENPEPDPGEDADE